MRNLRLYTLGSAALLAAVALYSYWRHQQFYPAAVALAQSRCFNLLLANAFGLGVIYCFLTVQLLCFGALRSQEREEVENVIYRQLMECMLTFARFASGRTMVSVAELSVVVAMQALHGVTWCRVEFVNDVLPERLRRRQTPRLRALTAAMFAANLCGVWTFAALTPSADGVPTVVLQNFVLMLLSSAAIASKLLAVPGTTQARVWRVVEPVLLVSQSAVHVSFFASCWLQHGFFPLHLIRGTVSRLRSLLQHVMEWWRRRALVRRLDGLVSDAPDSACDGPCPICFEPLRPARPKQLQCGHVFHRGCLSEWLVRQPACPYCRAHVSFKREGAEVAAAAATSEAYPAGGSDDCRGRDSPLDDDVRRAYAAYTTQWDSRARRELSASAGAGCPDDCGSPLDDDVRRAYAAYTAQWDSRARRVHRAATAGDVP